MNDRVDPQLNAGNRASMAAYPAEHFGWQVSEGVATVTLNRPERKNPLTFASYAELRDLFHRLRHATDVHVVVLQGAGGNFCAGADLSGASGGVGGGDAPAGNTSNLHGMRVLGETVLAIHNTPVPVVAKVDGICVGAGFMSPKTAVSPAW